MINDTTIVKGDTAYLPLFSYDLTGLNVLSGEFTFTYDTSLVQAVGAIAGTGTLLGSDSLVFSVSDDSLHVTFATPNVLSNSGILFKVGLAGKDLPGGSVDGPVSYPFPEERAGHFLHQPDAEGGVRSDAPYLLKLLGGG